MHFNKTKLKGYRSKSDIPISLYIWRVTGKTVTVPLSINFNCHVLLRFAFILFFCVLTCVSETVKKKISEKLFFIPGNIGLICF